MDVIEESEISFSRNDGVGNFSNDIEDEIEDQQLEEHRKLELANDMMNAFDDLESDDDEKSGAGDYSSREESYGSAKHHFDQNSVQQSVKISETDSNQRGFRPIRKHPENPDLLPYEEHERSMKGRSQNEPDAAPSDGFRSQYAYPATSVLEDQRRIDSLDEKYLQSNLGSKEDLKILYDARGREIERLTDALSTLKETSERHVRALKHQLELLKADKDDLKAKLKTAKTVILSSSDKENRLENAVERMTANVEQLKQENKQLFSENEEAANIIKTLEEELSKLQNVTDLDAALRTNQETLHAIRQRAETEITKLTGEKNKLKEDLENKTHQLNIVEKELSSIKTTYEQLLKEHETRVSELGKLLAHERQGSLQARAENETIIRKLEDDKRSLFDKLEKSEDDKRSLETHNETTLRRMSRNNGNSSVADLGLATPRQRRDSDDLDDSQLKETFKKSVFVAKQLRMKVEKLENEISSKDKEIVRLQESLQSSENAKQALESRINELSEECRLAREKLTSVGNSSKEKSIADELCKSLQSQLDSARGRLMSLEKESGLWRSDLESTNEELEQSRKENDRLRNEVGRMKTSLSTLKNEKNELQERLQTVSRQCSDDVKELNDQIHHSEYSHRTQLESELARERNHIENSHAAAIESLTAIFNTDRLKFEDQIISLKRKFEGEIGLAAQDAVARARLEWMKNEAELPREQFERSISDLDGLKATTDVLRQDRDKYREEVEKIRSRMYEDRRLIRERWKEEREKLIKKHAQLMSDQEKRIRDELLIEQNWMMKERIEIEKSRLRQETTAKIATHQESERQHRDEISAMKERIKLYEGQIKDKEEAVEKVGVKLEECRKNWEREKEALLANCKTSIPDLIRKISGDNPTLIPSEQYTDASQQIKRLRDDVSTRDEQLTELRTSVESLLEKFRAEVGSLRDALEYEKRYSREQREKYVELKKKSLKYQDYVLSKVNKSKEEHRKVDDTSKQFMKGLLGKITQELSTNEATSHLFPSPSLFTRETVKLTPGLPADRGVYSDNVFETPTAQPGESFKDSIEAFQSRLKEVKQGLSSATKCLD